MARVNVSRRGTGMRVSACPTPYTLYFDGACRRNPGIAGIGFCLYDQNGKLLEKYSSRLGYQLTNNVAEYKALIAGLQHALNWGIKSIHAYGDSELVCKQVNGEYKVKSPKLRRYYNTICDLLQDFQSYKVIHILREHNKAADYLANEGMDQAFVDKSPAAVYEIMKRCSTPTSTKQYILEKRCEGTVQRHCAIEVYFGYNSRLIAKII